MYRHILEPNLITILIITSASLAIIIPYTGKIASGNPETYLKNYYSKKYKSKSFISTDINTQIPSLYNLNGYENNLDNLLEQYNQQYENYQKQYENLLKDCLNQSNDLNNDYQFDYEDLLNQ